MSRRPRRTLATLLLAMLTLVVGGLAAPVVALSAQEGGVRLGVAVTPATATKEGPSITSANLLGDSKTRELLRNGFPARVHYRLELWEKGGLGGDDRTGFSEWDVLVTFDPTSQLFTVQRHTMTTAGGVNENFGSFSSLAAAETQFGRPYRAALHPERSGHFYYNLSVDVQTLTVSDLDALEQWLRGSSAPSRYQRLERLSPLVARRSATAATRHAVIGAPLLDAAETRRRVRGHGASGCFGALFDSRCELGMSGVPSGDHKRTARSCSAPFSASRALAAFDQGAAVLADACAAETAVLELFEVVQDFATVERLDVARLRRRESPNSPAQVHEVRLDRMRERVHPDLFRKPVALARVARAARGDDVRPVVRAAAREWDQVVARERLARLELRHVAAAVLAHVAVAREEERVRHLPAETPRHVDELREADYGWPRHGQSL